MQQIWPRLVWLCHKLLCYFLDSCALEFQKMFFTHPMFSQRPLTWVGGDHKQATPKYAIGNTTESTAPTCHVNAYSVSAKSGFQQKYTNRILYQTFCDVCGRSTRTWALIISVSFLINPCDSSIWSGKKSIYPYPFWFLSLIGLWKAIRLLCACNVSEMCDLSWGCSFCEYKRRSVS